MTSRPRPFVLHVPDAAIADLRQRLAATRFPDQAPESGWACGTELEWLRGLVEYWRSQFDWRSQEARLNAWSQYKVETSGLDLHYLHIPGRGPDPMPLLLAHGWPGSIFEFLHIIPKLIDPAQHGGDARDAFSVVVPSLPGYTLSYRPGQPRYSAEQMGDCFAELMTSVLGYRRFGIQGGDWGASIASNMGARHADKLIGIHLNFLPLRRDPSIIDRSDPAQARYLEELSFWLRDGAAYGIIQGTRPQTLSYGLTDSPAGLAAWIAEKMWAWSDNGGDIERAISKDELLANISLYWFTGSINASFWPYFARAHGEWPVPDGITVPTGYAEFPHEFLRPPQSLAARTYRNIQRWSVMEAGGHFAAWEQPDALAREIRAFFRPLRGQV